MESLIIARIRGLLFILGDNQIGTERLYLRASLGMHR